MKDTAKGKLIIIGGAEDKNGKKTILNHLVQASGGDKARIIVLTTATEKPDEVGTVYRNVFETMKVAEVNILNIDTRDDANDDTNIQKIQACTGIFFTGGDQLRITSILGGTKVYNTLQRMYVNGAVISGTSAGASVMCNNMIVDGNSNDPARKCTLKLAPGLGMLEDAIVDQHFHQRGRIGRLLCGVAENPHMLGIGIDEDTAIIVYPDRHFEVIGTNAVTVIDGKSIISSNVSELNPDEILSITNATLHILPQGYGFDMKNRKVSKLQ